MEVIQSERDRKAAGQWAALPASGALHNLSNYWTPSQSTTGPGGWLQGSVARALDVGTCFHVVALDRDQVFFRDKTAAIDFCSGRRDGPFILSLCRDYVPTAPLYFDVSLNQARGSALLNLVCNANRRAASPDPESTVTREVRDIEARLQLTRSQLAQALRVERATVYKWFRGSIPRSARTLQRIDQLRQFALAWSAAALGSARAAWYFRRPGTPTLGEMLTDETLDSERLLQLVQQMQQAPADVELVEPKGIYGFPAESEAEALRRRNAFFAATYSENE